MPFDAICPTPKPVSVTTLAMFAGEVIPLTPAAAIRPPAPLAASKPVAFVIGLAIGLLATVAIFPTGVLPSIDAPFVNPAPAAMKVPASPRN